MGNLIDLGEFLYKGTCKTCWAKGVGPTSSHLLAITLGLWAKWRRPRSFFNLEPTILSTKCQRCPNEWLLSGKIWEKITSVQSKRQLPLYNMGDTYQFKICETLTSLQSGRHVPVYYLRDTYQCTIWETFTSLQSRRHLPVYNLGDTYQFTIWETHTGQ